MPRFNCTNCNAKVITKNRPPKLAYSNKKTALFTNYWVCVNCGLRGKAVTEIIAMTEETNDEWYKESEQADWISQANV